MFLSWKEPVKLSFDSNTERLKLLFPITPLTEKFSGSFDAFRNIPWKARLPYLIP